MMQDMKVRLYRPPSLQLSLVISYSLLKQDSSNAANKDAGSKSSMSSLSKESK